jgi:NADP-dependent 3-hydroxy acid dehydrogenase YdfG
VTNERTRVALVTGANRGLGFETSRQLLAKGLHVVLTGRDEGAVARARRSLRHAEERAMTVSMDVTDVASIKRAQQAIARRFGSADILVNNAAVLLYENEAALAIPSEAYRRTFDTNVFGVIDVCRVFAPEMARAGYGRIVNVSSGAGQLATMSTYAPAYSMSKAALNAFTRILATPIKAAECWSMPWIQGGSGPTWVVRRHRDRRRRGPTRLSGSRRCPITVQPAASSTTVAQSSGREDGLRLVFNIREERRCGSAFWAPD